MDECLLEMNKMNYEGITAAAAVVVDVDDFIL